MKFAAFSILLVSTQLLAESPCPLDLSLPTVFESPAIERMLEGKGYQPTPYKKSISNWSSQRPVGHVLLSFTGPSCASSGLISKKWNCGPGTNMFRMEVITEASTYAIPKNISERLIGDVNKTFKSKMEAENFIIQELAKKIPSCSELRAKAESEIVSKKIDDSDRTQRKDVDDYSDTTKTGPSGSSQQ